MADIVSQFLANPTVQLVGLVVGLGLVALSFAAAWWVYSDASRRTESALAGSLAAGWILISTPLFLPLALAVYMAVRPRIGAADARLETLELDLAIATRAPECGGCGRRLEAGWVRCPTCARWLSAPCGRCGAWTDATFDICPACGAEERLRPTAALGASALAVAALAGPAAGGLLGVSMVTAAATGSVAAADRGAWISDQRGSRRSRSSARPRSYAPSRDNLSASS